MKAQKLKLNLDTRHAIFLQIIGLLWEYGDAGLRELADEAGCHWVTLYAWRSGRTTSPRLDKIVAVAVALGWEITIVKQKATKLRAVK